MSPYNLGNQALADDGGGSGNYLSFIGFTYVAFLMHCFNIVGVILQSQLAELRAQ
jgi:hypothetical protein